MEYRTCTIAINKISLLLLLLFAYGMLLDGKKLAEFDESFKGTEIHFDNKQLYIIDKMQRKIHIYSRKDFNKLAEFGRHGMGPGELNIVGKVTLTDNELVINSFPRLLFFSKKGKYLNETKVIAEAGSFVPLGNNFIGTIYPHSPSDEWRAKMQYTLFNHKLKKKKKIHLTEFTKFSLFSDNKDTVYWVRDCLEHQVYKNRLFISSTDTGFYFSVFDSDGDKLYEINREYKKRKVTSEEQQWMLEKEKKRVGIERWKQITAVRRFIFPECYPAFQKFFIENDTIYILKYSHINSRDVLFLDLKGKLLRKKTITNPKTLKILENYRFVFRMGKLYYMLDNAETEMWELHVENFN
ncbi:MAG: hypothetical protein GY757_33050 [bacterium]|nr:hypothetical protein [bacterium]